MNFPNNFNPQIILNNIAFVLTNNKVDLDSQENIEKIIEPLIKLHNSMIEAGMPKAKINKLKGINFNLCEISDIDDAIESSDEQIDLVQTKSYNEMEKLIIQRQKYLKRQVPESIQEKYREIIAEFKSIGYRTLDRKIKINSYSESSLNSLSEIFKNDSEFDAFVDTRKGFNYLEVYYPNHLSEEVFGLVNRFNDLCEDKLEHITADKAHIIVDSIPGLKDLDDIVKKNERRKETHNEINIDN